MPNRTMVPHGMFGCACFQVITPIPGMNINATAAMVVDEVSNRCRTPSVDQNPSSVSEIASSFASLAVIGPRSASALRIASRPPATSLTSGGIMRNMTK